MTDAEIIKALECCANNRDCKECAINPHKGNYGYCTSLAIKAALDLINRQKAEIERFKQIETTVNEFWCELQNLSVSKGKEKPTLEELLEYIEHAKAEAIEEFAERLDTHFKGSGIHWLYEASLKQRIEPCKRNGG